MSTAKVAITMEENLLRELDELVRQKIYSNRSKAIQDAVADKIIRHRQTRLATECAKLDIEEEREYSEEGFTTEVEQWPEY